MTMLNQPAAPVEESPQNAVLPPPPVRDVARPVANLGNTCYMNAVLQALAHAPELCMAMDVQPHHLTCPTYLSNAQKRRSSPSSSPDGLTDLPAKLAGTRKSRRSGKRSPTSQDDQDWKFCALCEVEHHLSRVHTITSSRDKPVAPSLFVHGFIGQVAPWFKLGQQEDSHEFLRLLIDGMQRSCKQARPAPGNPQDTPTESPGSDDDGSDPNRLGDTEYPFQLFRGMIESNVSCESCGSTSFTTDPIEDIGLDVTPASPSGTLSPTPGLADVSTALQRFARPEALDSGYKCENCGKVGRATKQARISSIPPILTLHLKRFRYGDAQPVIPAATGQGSRRSNRSSEVSQLLSNSNDFMSGKSGSAKIEGHSKFEQILDLRPYLTEEMQKKHSNMFCRLFAVVVHAGKNSHSGHYIAYVRNVVKNEWWKMDDARVTVAPVQEVMNAEAYMLFYRVVEHPFAVQLRTDARKLQVSATQAVPTAKVAPEKVSKEETTESRTEKPKVQEEPIAMRALRSSSRSNSRKRKAPDFTCGEEWARKKTTLPESLVDKFKDIEHMISEYVQFKPEFFKLLTDEASKENAEVGNGPKSVVCDDDIVDGSTKIKRALLEVFYEFDKHRGEGISFLKKHMSQATSSMREKLEQPLGVLTSSMVDPNEDALL